MQEEDNSNLKPKTNIFKRIYLFIKEKLDKQENEIDFTSGHIYKKMWFFIIPFIITSVLQLVYTSVDLAIVSNPAFIGSEELAQQASAAVGSNTSLINFCTGLFIGIATAANIIIAKAKGQNDKAKAERSLHSALLISVIVGVVLMAVGIPLTPTLLRLMSTPSEVMPFAIQYMTCYFIGVPFFMIFNFGASILRALGDSKRPMYTLIFTSIVNIVCCLIFVIPCKLQVIGVGLSLIISEAVSAFMVIFFLYKNKKGFVLFEFKKLKLHGKETGELIKEGLIIGSQAVLFGICTVMLTARYNQLDTLYGTKGVFAAANGAAENLEQYIYLVLNSFSFACLTMISQNHGALKKENLVKIYRQLLLTVTGVGLVLGIGFIALYKPLLGIFNLSDKQIEAILPRYIMMMGLYFTCALQEVSEQYCRGLGHNTSTTIISLVGGVAYRLVYILLIYDRIPDANKKVWILTLTYPTCWVILFLSFFVSSIIISKKEFKKIDEKLKEKELDSLDENVAQEK